MAGISVLIPGHSCLCLLHKNFNLYVIFSDLAFLVALTSTVFFISEFKKLVERTLEKRATRSTKSDLEFV